MKLFILALDGLEGDIVEKFGYKNLLQKKHGKLKVPISKISGRPSSPEVWASFLCAEHIDKEFEVRKNRWAFGIIRSLKKALPFLSIGMGKKVGGGIKTFQKLERKTWVDNPSVKEVDVPYYSYTNEVLEASYEFSKTKDLEAYRKRINIIFQEKKIHILREIRSLDRKNLDIIFVYLHFPDAVQHAWFHHKEEIYFHYSKLDEFVGVLKNVVGSTNFLIISDHGFDFSDNLHSMFGFISSNKNMVLPNSIIDLGKQIEDMLKNE
jgi:hypothetical protein